MPAEAGIHLKETCGNSSDLVYHQFPLQADRFGGMIAYTEKKRGRHVLRALRLEYWLLRRVDNL